MRPKIYSKRLLDNLLSKSQLWQNLNDEDWIKTGNASSELPIKSAKGLVLVLPFLITSLIFVLEFYTAFRMVFTSFSKSSKYPKDIYSGLIANYLKEDLLVQSWRNGAGDKLESDCTDKYKVQNIDRIGIKNFKSDWNTSEDHSKWGITTQSEDFTCIADINRMKSQFKRGGGSLCIHSEKVWKVFKKSIEAIEGCPMKSKNKSTTESSAVDDSFVDDDDQYGEEGNQKSSTTKRRSTTKRPKPKGSNSG